MANIKHYSNCGVCNISIATAHAKVIGATLYCPSHYNSLIEAGFDKLLGNPLDALSKLGVRK